MRYLLLICRDEPVWDATTPAERQEIYAETLALTQELEAHGLSLVRTGSMEIRPVREGGPS